MTPQELELLKSISERDFETFLPAGRTAADAKAFDDLVAVLQGMQRLNWIALEVVEQPARLGKYDRQYVGAAARCTEAGREVLRLLGE
jgi:hypothetical protein